MTCTNVQPMSFGNIFEYFFRCWELVRRRGRDIDDLEVAFMTDMSYAYLKSDWLKNEYDLRELDFFCRGVDALYEDFDPNYFIDNKFAYLEHLKNCYYFEQNG